MKLWNKLAQDSRVIVLLCVANAVQFVIIMVLCICLMTIPTRFTFHIPPDLSNGATLHANKIPKSYVGQFAFYIWQVINNWPTNGLTDASKNLRSYGAYLSPNFRDQMKRDETQLKSLGELQGRVRVVRPVFGRDPQVIPLDGNTWKVVLTVRDSEYVNGILVKDKEIQYPFRVARFQGNAQANPFGLVLDGFINKPKLLKVMQ